MQNETTTKEVRGLSANSSCSDGCGDALHILLFLAFFGNELRNTK